MKGELKLKRLPFWRYPRQTSSSSLLRILKTGKRRKQSEGRRGVGRMKLWWWWLWRIFWWKWRRRSGREYKEKREANIQFWLTTIKKPTLPARKKGSVHILYYKRNTPR